MRTARVQSIDAIKVFRQVLCGFADKAGRVLSDADAEVHRTLNWLEVEQHRYWEGQIRKRTEDVAKAKQAVLVKKLSRHVDGTPGTAIEEEKALRIAVRKMEEAHQKLGYVRRYTHQLQKEIMDYRGQVQRLANSVSVDLPLAVSRLDHSVRQLEAYVAAGGPGEAETVGSSADEREVGSSEASASMTRPEPVEPEQPPPKKSDKPDKPADHS